MNTIFCKLCRDALIASVLDGVRVSGKGRLCMDDKDIPGLLIRYVNAHYL